MTGSLQIKNGKYYAVLNTTVNGKRHQKWVNTGLDAKGNKRKANDVLHEMLLNGADKPASEAKNEKQDFLFSEYIEYWMTVAEKKVDPSTYAGYKYAAFGHVVPYFEEKGVTLSGLTRGDIQEYFDLKAGHGRKNGRGGLSPATLRQHKNIIKQTLDLAIKNDVLTVNPCSLLDLPKKVRYEANYYNTEQIKTLLEALRDDPLNEVIRITTLYGLRRSEVLGLKWENVDFVSRTVTIRHTAIRNSYSKALEKDKTKNESSRRSFYMTDAAYDIFKSVKEEENKNRAMLKDAYNSNDYVFKWPNGIPFSSDYVSGHFNYILSKRGLPHIRFHELRHSCASFLLNNGYTLKDVQEYMGHSDIQMTANIYGHLDTARKAVLSNAISADIF